MSNAPFTIDSVVVGRSARMRAVFDFVRVIADSDSSVLGVPAGSLTSESGALPARLTPSLNHASPTTVSHPPSALSVAS